ncbi:MAG: metallophosphoesterase [Deltaproteobacteria bacterium]|nr:metallophosphoesterase [Deltaproteobacteria bacterium]
MRIALISDLHANLVALDAVLADIAARGADQVVCLGDVATLGPHPREVLDRLRALDGPAILGNRRGRLRARALPRHAAATPTCRWCASTTAR